MMKEPSLKFVEELYTKDQLATLVREFQEKGYVILPDVLQRETVDAFRTQLNEAMLFDGLKYTIPDDSPFYIHGARAPRGRQILPHVLSRTSARVCPSLHTTILVIETDERQGYAPDWHKDREPDGMPGREYHFPLDVFLAFYFEDITQDHGPTLVIPGSHRDVSLTPYTNPPIEPVLCRKQDALLIDQRTWHRGIPRRTPGTRFLIVYGFYAMPHFYGPVFQMPRAQRRAWMAARTTEDRVYFGGPFAPPDQETLREMREELERSGATKTEYPRQT